jgi:hypothetical protein
VKRLALAALAVVLLAGCAPPSPGEDGYGSGRPPLPVEPSASPGPPSRSATSRPVAPCPPEGVLLAAGTTDAAMGLRALGVTLTNCGQKAYRVNGYPAVQALGKDRRTLDVKVLHGTTEIAGPIPPWNGPPEALTVAPGQQVSCVVVWRNTYNDIRRPPVSAPFLRVAAAPGRPSRLVTPDDPLDLGSTGRLGVSPWRRSEPDTAPTKPAPPPPTTPEPVPSSIL